MSLAASTSMLTGERAHRHPVGINRASLLATLRDRLGATTRDASPDSEDPQPNATAFWLNFFDAHRPRVVVGISLPSALCRAARSVGVLTAEPIHGFGLPQDDWVHGVAARLARDERDEPHVFVAFDDVTHKTLKLGSKGKQTTIVLASPPFAIDGISSENPLSLLEICIRNTEVNSEFLIIK